MNISEKTLEAGAIQLREDDQSDSKVQSYSEHIEEMPPITCILGNGQYSVIDGHHRVVACRENSLPVSAVCIAEQDYNRLIALDYDDIEISYAMLYTAKEFDAAESLAAQFSGASVEDRGLCACDEA